STTLYNHISAKFIQMLAILILISITFKPPEAVAVLNMKRGVFLYFNRQLLQTMRPAIKIAKNNKFPVHKMDSMKYFLCHTRGDLVSSQLMFLGRLRLLID